MTSLVGTWLGLRELAYCELLDDKRRVRDATSDFRESQMNYFNDDEFYKPSDPKMRLLGTEGCLAQWRCHGRGPAFIKFGNRVLYNGKTLNEWLENHVVVPSGEARSNAKNRSTTS